MNKGKQITDQTLKGAIVGVIMYAMAKGNVDAGLQASLVPLITAALAYASTCVGDKNVASFISKAKKKDYTEIIRSAEKVINAIETAPALDLDPPAPKKAVAKKAPAKKAPAKKAAPKKQS